MPRLLLLCLPALLAIAPFLGACIYIFRFSISADSGTISGFSLQPYIELADPFFLRSAWVTFKLASISTLIVLVLAVPLAILLASVRSSTMRRILTIPFSPPLSGLFSARYQFKDFFILKAPQLTADYRITAAQDEIVPPEEKTDGYSVLNMAVFTQIDVLNTHTPLEIRLKLNNVFDTKYYNHTSFYRLIDVPEAGRNISISLTQKL